VLFEDSLDFIEEILKQCRRIRELVGPSTVCLSSMPVVVLLRCLLKPGTLGWHLMRVVEPNKSRSIRCMKGHGIIQTMWSLIAFLDTFQFEFEPVSTIEIMDASVVAKQVLQPEIAFPMPFNIMS